MNEYLLQVGNSLDSGVLSTAIGVGKKLLSGGGMDPLVMFLVVLGPALVGTGLARLWGVSIYRLSYTKQRFEKDDTVSEVTVLRAAMKRSKRITVMGAGIGLMVGFIALAVLQLTGGF